MRLLMVTHFFEGHGGGIERVAGELSRALAAAGHEPVWAASDTDIVSDDQRIEICPLACLNPTERLTGLPMPVPLPRSLNKLRQAVACADAVVVHDALYLTSLAAARAARQLGKPLILIQHIAAIRFSAAPMEFVMKAANRLITEPMLSKADQVVFISDTVRRDFAHVPTRRAPRLIFNGVDVELFRPGEKTRAFSELPENKRIAAFVGRFVEKKGLSILREVAQSRPDISFALAGTGPIDPSSWALPNIYVLGRLSRERVAELFRSADMLLLPSVGEGYPLVIQEAMSCGLPVICGEASARADPAAAHWLTGVPINLREPASTAKQISNAIDRVNTEGAHRSQMASYAASAYSWPRMAAEIATIAEKIMN